jgi:hypothetical protein
VAGFASSASTIRQTERAQHRLIGTFANGVVIGRKANGESRFSWSVHPLKYACRGSTPDPLVRMGLESDPDRRRASALNATRQDSVQHPDSIDLS